MVARLLLRLNVADWKPALVGRLAVDSLSRHSADGIYALAELAVARPNRRGLYQIELAKNAMTVTTVRAKKFIRLRFCLGGITP